MHPQENVQLFVEFKSGEMIKQRTIRGYLGHLKAFFDYLPPDTNEILPSDIAKFLSAEQERGLSPTSIGDRYRVLKVFFNWRATCKEIGHPASPMEGMKPPKVSRVEPRRAALKDVKRLLQMIPDKTWVEARDKAVIQLMLDTGLRLGETSRLLVKDVNLDERIVFVKYGKGDKSRRVPFTKKTVDAINKYMSCRPKSKLARYLWYSSFNDDGLMRGVLTDYGIRSILKRRCERYRITHINPHSIRHLFGMKALNDGIRIEIVSAMMGHSSIDFTRKVYAPLLTETTKREYDANWK